MWDARQTGFVRYAGTVILTGEAPFFSMAYDCRLFLVLGKGAIRIGEMLYKLEAGDVVYIPPAVAYRFAIEGQIEIRTINFDVVTEQGEARDTIPPVIAADFQRERVTAFPPAPFDTPFICGPSGQISRLIEDIVSEKRFPGDQSQAMLSLMLGQCLLLLYRHRLRRVTKKEETIVRRLLQYMEAHLGEKLENAALAENFSYHPYYLNRVFKKATGETVHACLLRLRVERAAALLQTTDMAVEQIGAQVGFDNHAHFSKVFRKYTEMSPGEYRRTHPAI